VRIWRLFPLVLLLLTACTDLSAVTKFAQTAPDVTKLDTLTDIWVSDPKTQGDYVGVWQPSDPDLAKQTALRQTEKGTLDDLHALIVNYMKAVGGLAGASATDLSTQAKSVGTSLTALQKADTSLLTTAQVSSLSGLILLVPQDVLNIWRASEIGSIIKQNQNAFHVMVSTEIVIVRDHYIPDFGSTSREIDSSLGRTNGALGGNAAATRVTAFGFQQWASADKARLQTAITAAQQYVVALQKLAAAYDVLVDQSGHFTAATLQAILPMLIDAEKAYGDVNSL
jgi:hypothetical protein